MRLLVQGSILALFLVRVESTLIVLVDRVSVARVGWARTVCGESVVVYFRWQLVGMLPMGLERGGLVDTEDVMGLVNIMWPEGCQDVVCV